MRRSPIDADAASNEPLVADATHIYEKIIDPQIYAKKQAIWGRKRTRNMCIIKMLNIRLFDAASNQLPVADATQIYKAIFARNIWANTKAINTNIWRKSYN